MHEDTRRKPFIQRFSIEQVLFVQLLKSHGGFLAANREKDCGAGAWAMGMGKSHPLKELK